MWQRQRHRQMYRSPRCRTSHTLSHTAGTTWLTGWSLHGLNWTQVGPGCGRGNLPLSAAYGNEEGSLVVIRADIAGRVCGLIWMTMVACLRAASDNYKAAGSLQQRTSSLHCKLHDKKLYIKHWNVIVFNQYSVVSIFFVQSRHKEATIFHLQKCIKKTTETWK